MKQIYYNGTIIPMTGENQTAEALYVENGFIRGIGTLSEMTRMAPKCKMIDLQGHTLLPGFIDGHSHMISTAYELMFGNANPSPKGKCDSIPQMVTELKQQLQEAQPNLKKNQPYIAMGYDESAFPDKQPPSKRDLDLISREIPILLIHASGHNAVLNSKAMEMAGITDDYEIPAGGGMPKFSGTNEYTGLLQENAFIQMQADMKMPGLGQVLEAIGRCSELYASYGITTAQDAKVMKQQVPLVNIASRLGKLKQDVACYVDPEVAQDVLPVQEPWKNSYKRHVRMAGYKLFLDGSPQAKTAWLTQPYVIPPAGKEEDYCGFGTMTEEELTEHLKRCFDNHWQVNVHTNGDAAIDQLIKCYRKVQQQYPREASLRPAFIHCQTVREDQLDDIRDLGMLISFFEDHVYYWGDYHYASVLGPERAEHISPIKSARDRGINCTLHQDSPVVNPNVIFAVHNAVNRVTKEGRVLGADQRVSVYEALRCVTYAGAYQLYEEEQKGTLEPGKVSDLVIIDQNPLTTEPDKLKDIQVLTTIKSGKVIYSKKDC